MRSAATSATPPTPDQVVWAFAGVRPLHDDAEPDLSAITRDYVFDLHEAEGEAPLLSIFGGKITTYRKLAEHALDRLQPVLRFSGRPWTANAPLPGGDLPDGDFEAFLRGAAASGTLAARRPGAALRARLRQPGRSGSCWRKRLSDLGERLGDGLYEAEVDYLRRQNGRMTAEDILLRRSKLGLHVSPATVARLEASLGQNVEEAPSAVVARS